MASLRKKLNPNGSLRSAYWFCRYKDPMTGKVIDESTKGKIGTPEGLRTALKFKNEKEALELSASTASDGTRWQAWVPAFLKAHYSNPKTLARMEHSWGIICEYLETVGAFGPEFVDRKHGTGFVNWRESKGRLGRVKRDDKGQPVQRPVNRNTVIQDLKLLVLLMNECVAREWIQYNPLHRLKIERARVKHRGEIQPEHEQIIRAALAERLERARNSLEPDADKKAAEMRNADCLNVSFNIVMLSGMRQHETHFNLKTQVDWRGKSITLRAKGKEDYSAPMSPNLEKYLRGLLKEGRTLTYELPPMLSLVWFKFMDGLRKKHPELQNVHFHGSRSAVISRLEEAGAPEKVVMGMVNHSSVIVHRIYRRVRSRELDAYWNALSSSPSPAKETTQAHSDTLPPTDQPAEPSDHKNQKP